MRGPDAGFALATSGLGSAVVLNVILWLALLVSIPAAGFNPLYVTAAIVGVVIMGIFAAIVVGLMKGEDVAERALRAVARRVRWLDEQKTGAMVKRLATRLRELMSEPQLLRRVVIWAVVNWLLDAASLWVFLRAYGTTVRPDGLLVAFGLANVLAALPITPGGLGIVEGVLIPTLVGFGADRTSAALGVAVVPPRAVLDDVAGRRHRLLVAALRPVVDHPGAAAGEAAHAGGRGRRRVRREPAGLGRALRPQARRQRGAVGPHRPVTATGLSGPRRQ